MMIDFNRALASNGKCTLYAIHILLRSNIASFTILWSLEITIYCHYLVYIKILTNTVPFPMPQILCFLKVEKTRAGRGLRVLSLCDGIATVKVALENLGLQVDAYYASEININAQNMVRCYHGDKVTYIGDTYTVDKEMVKNCPSVCDSVSLWFQLTVILCVQYSMEWGAFMCFRHIFSFVRCCRRMG